MTKGSQLQIRVSRTEKARIGRLARAAGMNVSQWVLSRALPEEEARFESLLRDLARQPERASLHLAALHDWLAQMPGAVLARAVATARVDGLDGMHRGYVAAMVEQACSRKRIAAPHWTAHVGPLSEPYFASDLASLRPHLLRASPPPFRRRNIFIDSSIGDRV